MKPQTKKYMYGTGLLLIGLLSGYLIFGSPSQNLHDAHDHESTENNIDQHVLEEHTDEEGNIVYTCSMHPSVRENEPGKCPICGMDLIPATSEAREDDYSMVMTEAAIKLANIQTTMVTEEVPTNEIHLPGRIKVDERRLTNVSIHFPGRIQELFVDFTGAPIQAGQAMATIYSSELVTAQRELLTAIRHGGPQSAMAESAREKLRQWELTDGQVKEIEQRGEVRKYMEIVSPVDGYVISRNVSREDHVAEGSVLFEVANLDQVWAVFEAYEDDLAWLQEGDPISFSSRSNPGQQFDAEISYINPVVDPHQRTVQIRADIENGESLLKPDMLISGLVESSGREGARKMIPASSVLWTGPRSIAFVKDPLAEVPRFEAREIELGNRAGDHYIVHSGLDAGEEVVFNGAFRLDSEFQLADRFSMMNREPGLGRGMPAMPGMDMDMDETEMDDMEHQEMGAEFDDIPQQFKSQLTSVLDIYLKVKDELINSDFKAVNQLATELEQALDEVNMSLLEGDAHLAWMEHHQNIQSHIGKLFDANDLEAQRSQFKFISNEMAESISGFGIEGTVYKQYCPMEEAYWLSSKEDIDNPYMEEMPGCGEVIERIEN